MKWIDKNLHIKPINTHIDPYKPVENAIITHGHADHAKPGHKNVLATSETIEIMKIRYGENCAENFQELKLDIKVETRTGDTSSYKKVRQKQEPPHMLMTTPESLALLLASPDANDYFKFLKFLIIDEIHSLVNSKRGDLLSLNLSRLDTIVPNYRKIGLSATVKNTNPVLSFLSKNKKAITLNVEEKSFPNIEI